VIIWKNKKKIHTTTYLGKEQAFLASVSLNHAIQVCVVRTWMDVRYTLQNGGNAHPGQRVFVNSIGVVNSVAQMKTVSQ
jgi:hypothetical protein